MQGRLLLSISCLLVLPSGLRAADPALPTTVHAVEGLSAELEILLDRWGVPHIYAESLDDVFFAQGWNAARDRLWQLDVWKRRGDGTLAEVFGRDFVEKDRAARLFLFRGDMHAEWLAYASDTKRIVSAFVDGLNGYIRLTRQSPELLPLEFELLDYAPALWTPETVVRIRSHGLLWNAREEASRAKFVRDHGLPALRFRERLAPHHKVSIPDGLDLSAIPDDVLAVYDRARRGVRLARSAGGQLTLAALSAPERPYDRSGSNNWAVAATRAASGRAMLANDPHRALSVPSLRYIVHLSAPGLDVIGAGEPSLPGVSIGHNGRVAFGLTIFFIDQEDLYVYQTRPGSADEYRYRDRWEPMRIVTERIPVRDSTDVEVKLAFTRHGPIVYDDPERNLAIGLRAAWLEPGMAPYLGSISSMRAQTWDEFLAAMNRWGLPPENLVYADVAGNIGWKPGGLAPIRPNWDGLLPVPGDGRYEWAGFRDMDELPVEHNPPRGWIATANQMNLPKGYPHALGFEWILPYRYDRIREVLGPERLLTFDDMVELQSDTHSVAARRVRALLDGIRSGDPGVERALGLLRAWDGSIRADSAAAALYEVWAYRHLARAVMGRWVDDAPTLEAVLNEDVLYDVFEGSSAEVWLSRLEDPSQPRASRDKALLESLAAAIRDTESLLGADWEAWSWGRLHRAELSHPVSALLPEAGRSKVDVGPAPRGGSGATVNAASYTLADFVQRYGATFRMVLDVGSWDDSVAMNSPGQSGDPSSPHYRDLFGAWARDESFPLLYSRDRVLAATERRVVLRPAATQKSK
ncbi:MAG: penicillin acylase family protein [Myxococcota bacterium]